MPSSLKYIDKGIRLKNIGKSEGSVLQLETHNKLTIKEKESLKKTKEIKPLPKTNKLTGEINKSPYLIKCPTCKRDVIVICTKCTGRKNPYESKSFPSFYKNLPTFFGNQIVQCPVCNYKNAWIHCTNCKKIRERRRKRKQQIDAQIARNQWEADKKALRRNPFLKYYDKRFKKYR